MAQQDNRVKQIIPNLLSISRIILSLLLLAFFKNPIAFMVVYMLAGFTDFADGYLARRFKAESILGSRLDSAGDVVFFLILLAYLLITQKEVIVPFYFPILVIFLLRMVTILVGLIKFKKLVFWHTLANKLTGVLVFLLPAGCLLRWHPFLVTTAIVAFLASIEEFMIVLQTSRGAVDLNRKSLFMKQK